MSVLHLGHPTLHGGLLVVATEQQLGRIATLHILKHANPVVHGGMRVGRQVVDLLPSIDLEGGGTFGATDATGLVQLDLTLRLPLYIVLTLPVVQRAILEDEPTLAPGLQLATQLGQVTHLREIIMIRSVKVRGYTYIV